MKPWEYGKLRISDNHRYLCNGNTPFFWLGDTAWLLFSRLSEKEAEVYFRNRKDKGYSVIQATLVHEWPQKNVDGAYALKNNDFSAPDLEGGYWQRVIAMVEKARDLGLYMALLPAWGSQVMDKHLTMENADPYLDYLIESFGKYPNVIWLLGGDVKGEANPELYRHMGQRLKKETDGHLVGFHPFGRHSSSIWFHQEDWLDFNMFQSGHRRYDQAVLGTWDDAGKNPYKFGEDNWRYVCADQSLSPLKPVLDGEPSYEQILQGLHDKTQPYWQAWDTRRYAYWSVFAGACGHTFGDNSIMQFFVKERDKEGSFGVWQDWQEAMHNSGGMEMTHLKNLMESVDYQNGRCAQELIAQGQGEKYDYIGVFAGEDFIFTYIYQVHPFALDLIKLPGSYDAWWMDPCSGGKSYLGTIEGGRVCHFSPMERKEGHSDWVLILQKK